MKTNQLVKVRNGNPVTTSLQIAQVFGRNHYDVLRDIRGLECSSKFIARNFAVYHYHSKLNENVTRQLPMYYITRDGFTFLAMGFTGKIAAQFKEDYINAFNEMERKLKTEAVPKIAIQDAQQEIEYWKRQAGFWLNLYSGSTEIMSMMSKNELRLAEMMVGYREENKLLLQEKNQVATKTNQQSNYFTVVGYASLYNINCGIKLASSLGRKASVLCNAKGIQTEEIPDPRFGRVKTYPAKILEEVFNANAY